LHASPFFVDELRRYLREARETLRDRSFGDYERTEELLDVAAANARSMLPRTSRQRLGDEPAVAMFTCDDTSISIDATRPADDGDGVIVVARESNGRSLTAAIRCAARAREASPVDESERPVQGGVELRDSMIVAEFAPNQVRAFRVKLA
jgi:hypothetical protein